MIYQIGVEPVRVDVMNAAPGLTFAWEHRTEAQFDEITAPVLSLKDLIKAKLAAGARQGSAAGPPTHPGTVEKNAELRLPKATTRKHRTPPAIPQKPERAGEVRASLGAFETDCNAPGMEAYDHL